jgi:hypothetical protein
MIVHLLSIITISGGCRNMFPLNKAAGIFGDMHQYGMRGNRMVARSRVSPFNRVLDRRFLLHLPSSANSSSHTGVILSHSAQVPNGRVQCGRPPAPRGNLGHMPPPVRAE